MVSTRRSASASSSSAAAIPTPKRGAPDTTSTTKRQRTASASSREAAVLEDEAKKTSTPKRRKAAAVVVPWTPNPAPNVTSASLVDPSDQQDGDPDHIIVRPGLSFDYEHAKRHLIAADERFRPLMEALPCKPFTDESDLNPFRALCSSILGQQISWLAARSITHKFIRLVAFPDLPEKPGPTGMTHHFPTPRQVANTPMETLRAAGLSGRKAEYVLDLATRFVDGRLSSQKLLEMTDEQVMEHLIQVRGIGRWTVEMFMIFTLRRPNVLPCGDLGVQKGLVRWWTTVNPSILSKKLPEIPGEDAATPSSETAASKGTPSSSSQAGVPLSSLTSSAQTTSANGQDPTSPERQSTPEPSESMLANGSSDSNGDYFKVPTTPMGGEVDPSPHRTPTNGTRPPISAQLEGGAEAVEVPLMTPRTEKKATLPPFPESETLTLESCRARLNKKIKGNIYLSPKEMHELTKSWEPYRSIGVWYLWSLADGDATL